MALPENDLKASDMIKRRFVEKRVNELTAGWMVTDAIFMPDPSDTPAIKVETNEDGLDNWEASDQVEERTEDGQYPKIGWTTEFKQYIIRDYGLGVTITHDDVRFNRISKIQRSYILLGNSLIKFVDGLGLRKLTDNYNVSSTRINTLALSTPWSDPTSDPFVQILTAKSKVEGKGYDPNLLVVNPSDWNNALMHENFRKQLDEDVPPERKIVTKGARGGEVAGLTVVKAKNLLPGQFAVLQDRVVGNRSELTKGVQYDIYKAGPQEKAANQIDAYREFEDYLTDPKAVCLAVGN